MALAPELMYDEMAVALSYGLMMSTIASPPPATPASASAPAPAPTAAPPAKKGKKEKKEKKVEEGDDAFVEEHGFGLDRTDVLRSDALAHARCPPCTGDEEEEEEEAAAPGNDRKAKAAALKAARDKELEEKKAAALERLAKKEAKQRSLCNLEASPHRYDCRQRCIARDQASPLRVRMRG